MVPLQLDLAVDARPARSEQCMSDAAFAFLNYLRFTAMSCRVKRRTDLFHACALLHASQSASRDAHADALMRCLAEAFDRHPRLHAPGTVETSFDENWLVRTAEALARADDASVAFLLRSRVLPEHRRLIRFLLGRISDSFALI